MALVSVSSDLFFIIVGQRSSNYMKSFANHKSNYRLSVDARRCALDSLIFIQNKLLEASGNCGYMNCFLTAVVGEGV